MHLNKLKIQGPQTILFFLREREVKEKRERREREKRGEVKEER